MRVGDILRIEPESVRVIRKHGLHNFENSNVLFEEACRQHAVDPQIVKKELIHLRLVLHATPAAFNQILEDTLQKHEDIKHTIPQIREALHRASEHNSKLFSVKKKFEWLVENLEVHFYKEENILFPEFIKLWKSGQEQHEYITSFPMMYPIEGLEAEHEWAKEILDEITAIIRDCRKSGYADQYCNEVYSMLQIFKKQLKQLIKQESGLFPQALTLERLYM
ncbi:MAG: hemerythrin domain-containing protein [Cytophagales bacterium]|nr:hemerythrin domain-containing protein [Cytophagales bacterium]